MLSSAAGRGVSVLADLSQVDAKHSSAGLVGVGGLRVGIERGSGGRTFEQLAPVHLAGRNLKRHDMALLRDAS